MLLALIKTMITIGCFIIQKVLYRNDDKYINEYKKGKSDLIETSKPFIIISKYLQLSTLIFCLYSFFKPESVINNQEILIISPIIGFILLFASQIMIFMARKELGKNYSHNYESYAPSGITTSGIYKIVRHPIYTSNLLLIFSLFLLSGNYLLILNLMILFYFYNRSAKREEIALSKIFPEYLKYKKTTGRLLPGINL